MNDKQDEQFDEMMRKQESKEFSKAIREAYDPEILQGKIHDRDKRIDELEKAICIHIREEIGTGGDMSDDQIASVFIERMNELMNQSKG